RPLCRAGSFGGCRGSAAGGGIVPLALIEHLVGGRQRFHEHRADLRCEPATHDDHPVAVVVDGETAARVAARGLSRFRLAIHPPPRTIDSTWAAVPARPTPSKRSSVSGVATRVSARTFA